MVANALAEDYIVEDTELFFKMNPCWESFWGRGSEHWRNLTFKRASVKCD